MERKSYTIEELGELTGYSRRTIRYYVQECLIDPPAGRGRGGYYYDSHIQQLLQIKSFQEKGIGITAMVALMKKETKETKETVEPVLSSREVMIRYEIVPGIEVNISREMEIKEPKKILEIIRIAKSIAKGDIKDE